MPYLLTIPSVFVRVRPSHALIEPAKEPISQDLPMPFTSLEKGLLLPPVRCKKEEVGLIVYAPVRMQKRAAQIMGGLYL
jgi:hypothetical protein